MKGRSFKPPLAKKIDKKLTTHGHERVDPYYWMNDREDKDLIDYLEQENEFYNELTANTKEFQKDLYEEMKGRIKEEDETVPYKKNGYYYITRFELGKQYPIYTRKKHSLKADEEILFDVNEMAKGHEYFRLSGISVSPDNQIISYGTDTFGRRQYNIRFKNFITGEQFPEVIENTTGSIAWASDNKTVFYTQKDPVTLRSNKIFRHIVGTDPSTDIEVYHEEDESFSVYVYRTKSEKFIMIGSYSTLSTEYRYLLSATPYKAFKIFQKRVTNLEYNLAHFGEHFYILTNKDDATNFKVMRSTLSATDKNSWVEVIPHREHVLVEDISIFKEFLVVEERTNGLNRIRILFWDNSEDFYLPFDEDTYAAGVYYNPEFDTTKVRIGYSSLTTPSSVIDFDVNTKTKEIKKEHEVLGGKFNKKNYISERIWVTAADGCEIPVSLVRHKKTEKSENTPLLMYGYGSYGFTIDAGFSTTRLSLLDRGFIFAIAHVRGSEYLGRKWYEGGKLLNKLNTFTDFISCANYLINNKYTSSKHLYASGGSAGGLLIGAVINMAPQLFNGVVATVPFVDVVTTMLDETIPLTTGEYDEWGNPAERQYYEYMMKYSPYDNVAQLNYPHMLITSSLHDSQVQYFEPTKWVAKLRENKINDKSLFLYTNMTAGHSGASGRFDALKETAREFTFIIELEGKRKL